MMLTDLFAAIDYMTELEEFYRKLKEIVEKYEKGKENDKQDRQ